MPTTALCRRGFAPIAPGDRGRLTHTLNTERADVLRAATAPTQATDAQGVMAPQSTAVRAVDIATAP